MKNPSHNCWSRSRVTWGLLLLLAAFTAAAYHNSLGGPFLFDDRPNIVNNPRVQRLWPLGPVIENTQRPVMFLSFALNWALHEEDVQGYHLGNAGIHLLAGLVLFGLVRRTLLLPCFAGQYDRAAPFLAAAVAGLWLVHPLQTQSVTYIVQRAESLMGLFFLLALYCLLRGAAGRRGWPWYTAAVLFCGLGMGSKEVAFVAPLVAILFDRAVLSASFRELFTRRWPVYAAMSGLAVWLLVTVFNTPEISTGAGFGFEKCSPWEYFRSQPSVIWHYLRLAVWPEPLCFDYQWPIQYTWSMIALTGLPLLGLLGASLWAFWRGSLHWRDASGTRRDGSRNGEQDTRGAALRAWGFLGLAFFLVLAPTSSFVPIAQLAAEHRMYLPLAVVVTAAVLAGYEILRRTSSHERTPILAGGLVLCLMGLLTWRTIDRNEDYRSEVALWRSVVKTAPQAARGWQNLGIALVADGQEAAADGASERAAAIYAEAATCCEQALDLRPNLPHARNGLGMVFAEEGKWEQAGEQYRLALQVAPDYADAHHNLANVLAQQGEWDEAIGHYRQALRHKRNFPEAHHALGVALTAAGQWEEAVASYRQALALRDDFAASHCNLGTLLRRQGRFDAAREHLEKALELRPNYAEAHHQYAAVLAMFGVNNQSLPTILQHELRAVELNPDLVEAHFHLGNLYVKGGDLQGGLKHYREAVRIAPDNFDVQYNLAILLSTAGQDAQAVEHYRKALKLRPEANDVRAILAWTLSSHKSAAVRDGDEAVRLAQELCKQTECQSPQAWDSLAAAYAETGNFTKATEAAEKAEELALKRDLQDLAFDIHSRTQLYRQGQPFRARSHELARLW